MVRERKKRFIDIEKLHELIDSASLPKHKVPSLRDDEKLESLRQRLSEGSLKNPKEVVSSDLVHTTSGSLKPQVVVHKREETQKKEEKVIQITLGPRQRIKEKEQAMVNFIPVKEDPFVREPLFEIEKVAVPWQEFTEVKPITLQKKSATRKEFIPLLSVRKRKEKHLPSWKPVLKKTIDMETPDRTKEKLTEAFPPKVQPIEQKPLVSSSLPQEQDNEIPSFEPVEFKAAVVEKDKSKQLEEQKQQKEQKEQRLLREREEKQRLEQREKQQKEKEELKRKKIEAKKAEQEAKEKKLEAKGLLKEREEKQRLEQREKQQKDKEERKRKKIEAKQSRLELKEKKLEAKRLAKEHDRKLKLEWLEFQHKQRQNQKRKDFEKKKAAVKAKEKEQEEQRHLKEREEKLRLEQREMLKKEKEGLKQKKIEAKKAEQEAKEKKLEAKRLAKEQEKKLKIEQIESERKQREEQKQKELEKKQAATQAQEKEQKKQRLLREREEKQRLEQREKQQKEKEKQKTSTIKKEKNAAVAALFEKRKASEDQPKISGVARLKPEKTRKKILSAHKGEQTNASSLETFSEKTHGEIDSKVSVTSKEPSIPEKHEKILKEKKYERMLLLKEQKRLLKQQKEKERLERLELKKKEKEQKIQKKLEEIQRDKLIGSNRETKDKWKQKKLEEKLARREAKEKEREAKKLAIEKQKKKGQIEVLQEIEEKKKEKKEKKRKQINDKKDREHTSKLGIGKAKNTGLAEDRKRAGKQKYTMDLVRIAAEEKELRKTKAFERKRLKEEKKREKEEQKFKKNEEMKAQKKMDLHMQEEIIKEKVSSPTQRNDPFVAFDSIDEKTVVILGNFGYTSVEKLRQASVKDLMKIGLKKKIAQSIIAECGEFVEWEVMDTNDQF